MLDQLIGAVRSGDSRSLVVHGEPGVGKTALLDYVAVQALGCRVVRASGVQSEMELPFAGLHQVCAPLLDRLDQLPGPQQDALGTAFGISAGAAPDRFLVGLAVLGLLSQTATEQPLMCLIDDLQWLDRVSAQVLAFVVRRLGAEAVGIVMATRAVDTELSGTPELEVGGLRAAEAGALLDIVLTGPVDARIRDQIIAETRGNPLALLELPHGLTSTELAGGFGLPGAGPLSGSIEESFARRFGALPEAPRRLLLIAASDPSGDSALVWSAAGVLGIGTDAAGPATEAGLVEIGARVRFRHPLARSAVYRSASLRERRRAHGALAEVIDPRIDPDRRAWHRAQAAAGPDEDVAAELEGSASRARARGGLAAAAAFLSRAATLTLDPELRAGRALASAEAALPAGAYDTAVDLLAMAETGPLNDFQRARADLIRAQLAFMTNRGSDAPVLLLKAAARLESVDPALARETYLDALSAAIFAGRLADPAGDVLAVARAAGAAAPSPGPARIPDLLLDGTAALFNLGYPAGVPTIQAALRSFRAEPPAEEELRWLWMANMSAVRVWDDSTWHALSARHLRLARDAGALAELPLALTSRAFVLLFSGELAATAALTGEAQAIGEATGTGLAAYGIFGLAAFRGDEATPDLVDAALSDAGLRGEGVGVTMANWARAVFDNGRGRYEDALAAAMRSTAYTPDTGSLIWSAVELIEAAVRSQRPDVAADTFRLFAEITGASGSDWALGLRSRCGALLADGDEAGDLYRRSITLLGRTRMRVDLARAHLLYGEWLRRARRLSEAREQLRTAHTLLDAMGMTAFAERAARELRSAGGTVGRRVDASRHDQLTAQEAQIAWMARDGLSNPEIALRLFISAHTVQYHLRKVFTKLGVTSRSQLDQVLPLAQGAHT